MSGCGGCEPGQCNGPCSRRSEAPRDKYTLTDALAQVITDNRVIRFTMEYVKNFPLATADEIIVAANLAKEAGELA